MEPDAPPGIAASADEFEHHRKHASFFLKEGLSLSERFDNYAIETSRIRQQIAQLEQKAKLQRQAWSDMCGEQAKLEKQAAQDLVSLAKVTCRDFCNAFYTRFPRELRDLVYEHIIENQVVTVYEDGSADDLFDKPSYFVGGRINALEALAPNSQLPHYADQDYVGHVVAREIVGTWFQRSTFSFGDEFRLLPKFVQRDIWDLGLSPDRLVSKLEFEITDEGWRSIKTTLARDAESGFDRFSHHIESLFNFKKGKHISMGFQFSYGAFHSFGHFRSRGDFFKNVLEVMIPIFTRLKHTGYILRVSLVEDENHWDKKPVFEFSPEDAGISIEEWTDQLKQYEVKWSQEQEDLNNQ